MAIAASTAIAALAAVDVWLHGKFERSAGFNIWGYRGPVAARKTADEYRVVVLGGSTVYGYGTTWEESIPAVMDRDLRGRAVGPFRRFSVVNLGYNNEGAYSFRFTLQDFAYLTPDLAVLYEGYNDLPGDYHPNHALFRHGSPVFALTGYMPILPLVFNEKALALRHGGDLGAAYADPEGRGAVVFRPDLASRATASTLETIMKFEQSLETPLRRLSNTPAGDGDVITGGCDRPWHSYCESVALAVDYALSHHQQVIVAGQPRLMGGELWRRHENQQRALAEMLRQRYGGDRRVRYVDLAYAIDLSDRRAAPDGMHLRGRANRGLAQLLVEPILDMLRFSSPGSPPSSRP